MNELLTINNESLCENSPQEFFDKAIEKYKEFPIVFRIVSIIGWGTIEGRIIENKQQISYYSEGLELCFFCINVIAGNDEIKTSERVLHFGTECLKSLHEIDCNQDCYLSEEDRIKRLQWGKEVLDIWKERFEECLIKENRVLR